ncbi:glycosaminoglycan xylosylkinase-like isoform X2 [Pomacea canaliculata]|uniref:glycosaminoglycan xylosylkinase-like isoform X2 n=1 Tax=Pomacea canaliculata TaxID=400727 RepID=UPI000D72AEAC|nr:glycosaminoglycan xylosylkinase-like isoform X2 [Pomacea canaliculata]
MDEESDIFPTGQLINQYHDHGHNFTPDGWSPIPASVRPLREAHEPSRHTSSWKRAYIPGLVKHRLRLLVAVAVAVIMFCFSLSDTALHTSPASPWAKETTEDKETIVPTLELKVERLVQKHRVDLNRSLVGALSPWQTASAWVTSRQIIPDFAPRLGAILGALAKGEVTQANINTAGTQLKLTLELEGQQMVVFKPMFYERSTFLALAGKLGRDRHNAEIASFHLSRILNIRRVPLAVGRLLNLRGEVIPVATQSLMETFYVKDGRDCFYGACRHCTELSGVCTNQKLLEGVVILWLPPEITLSKVRHPWRLDFKTAILNNFGNPYYDEVAILAPLQDCCMLRMSTWNSLQLLRDGVLSRVLKEVLRSDPIHPVLIDSHFLALDRRLKKVFQELDTCVQTTGLDNVLVDDGL